MKRILLLSFYYTPDLCAGSFRTAALINELIPLAKSLNIHIDLVTTMPNRYSNYQAKTQAYEQEENLHICRVQLPCHHSGFIDQAKAFAAYYFSVKKFLRKKKKYDCVVATSSRLFTAFLAANAAKKYRCPLLLDIRDIFTETMEALLSRPIKILFLPIFKQVENYTFKKASVINLVSPDFASYLLSKINSACHLTYISNGVDVCFNNITTTKNKNKIKTILYAGNIGLGQALEKIIPYLAQHTIEECLFKIIGSGGKLQALKAACAGLKNIEIIDPISREALIREYQNADILFLHLGKHEPFERVLPSKIFEYTMTGKPILAGISGYSERFLQEHVSHTEVFPPCDGALGLEKLRVLMQNQETERDTTLFYEKFNRKSLMQSLSKEIVNLVV
ncbi:MAG: glycosyltransferase family 4 protein [Coxiellaceae bacterium]|nr:glycosyltransferase family 4 protein [Coxiellaceae bacterium]